MRVSLTSSWRSLLTSRKMTSARVAVAHHRHAGMASRHQPQRAVAPRRLSCRTRTSRVPGTRGLMCIGCSGF
ncbi:hypothetical protein PsYK624_119150 [Phanerochaete sordida]|uniref:Uncharacterized protein n=1 Tax=Phanerochaete sordida TaxID=48140 RepID=A0A9P3GK32_9APHY|nr:hypothetical protein PsYK624_119150 [Phanerochaete sordida]